MRKKKSKKTKVSVRQKLFSYGTIQNEDVQEKILGKRLKGERAVLTGYVLGQVYADGGFYPCIFLSEKYDKHVFGTVFEVSEKDLKKLDEYESEAYRRQNVIVYTESEHVVECVAYVENK